MNKRLSKRMDTKDFGRKLAEDFRGLANRVLLGAKRGLPRIDFLLEVSKMLLDFSGCDAVELRLKRRDKYHRCEATRDPKQSFVVEHLPCTQTEEGKMIPCLEDDSGVEKLCREIILGRFDSSLPFFTKNGSFWTGDVEKTPIFRPDMDGKSGVRSLHLGGDYRSLALFPIIVDEENTGLLQLKSKQPDYFSEKEIEFYEGFTQTLGEALALRSAQVALRERVKELTCLYGIAQLSAHPDIPLEEILQGIAELLPPGWLYPEIASGRIILDGRSYTSPGFKEGVQRQTADIVVREKRRGVVEVSYAEDKPDLDEGPFLKEERSLINAIAREVSLIIERRETEAEKETLQNQLMHADRLATIGQLAAGVAHELNEPLGNILGFAQLAKKSSKLPKQSVEDIEKIVAASLHAREVVKKLMIFARQMPPQKTQVNLNQVVEEGLYFFESRCAKEGIEMVRLLSPNLPEITADPGQLHQVLVNLVVNALQAMPKGGKLTIRSFAEEGYVLLAVEDTGIGMSEEVMKQIFVPFFTTKEVGEGTGLGLSVVHGIVTSHGGSIKVESKIGHGARFEIRLPVAGYQDVKESVKDGKQSEKGTHPGRR